MITIVYLENPFKPQNRVVRQISAAEAPAVIDAIALLNANLSGEMILSVNGQKVAADHSLKDGDFVVIAPNVLGGGGGSKSKNVVGIVAGIALMAFSGGAGAGLLGILGTTQGSLGLGLALYSGGSLLMGNQRLPKIDTPNVQSSFENGYGWSPNQVRLQPGSPLPITYGTFKTSGQLIARRVYPGDFAGKQTQYLSMLLAAGEGQIDMITDIEINDTPIASIQGATSDYRLGTNNQTEIPGISRIIEDQVFSSELPLSGSAWITKTQPEPGDEVILTFVFPAGLYAVDTRSGATIPCRGAIRWQYREVGASSWIPLRSVYYWEQTRRPFYFVLGFNPPDKTKTYEFRAQNYTLERYREIEGGDWVGLTEMPGNYSAAINWIGLTVKSWKKQAYPGTALVYINLPATENLSGSMPKVSWKQTRATVNVWNPTEEEYQAKDATNIAWMVYDLLHQCKLLKNIQTGYDEYVVFGEPKENLNYTEFAAWASFCAETAGGAPRGKGNALIDSPEQIWPIVQKVATSGRGFIVQQAGVFKPVWDSTRTMSQIFTAGNIIDGSLSGSFLPERERASALEVSFFDEDNGYERTTLFVPGDDYNPAGLENPSQIFLPCITSSKVAYMWAKHQLKKNKYLKRTATMQADIDSIVAELGDVVGVQSDITSWGVGGRILGATTTSVVIDQAVTLEPGNTYSLLIRYPDNTLVRRVIDAVLVSTTTTTLNFTGAPWPAAPERFCIYSFGINTLETKPFQITDIRRNGDLQATLELLEYVADVHTEATDFPVIDYTAASAGISSLTVKADSDTGKLGIAWTIPTDRDYAGSVVYVDGKPQGFFPTDATDIDIDAPPGTHTVTVRPVDGSGNYGTEAEEEVTLGDPALAAISSPSLSSTIRGQADGTNLVYITGTFTIPDLASSVLVEIGEGSNPASWATVQDSRVDAVLYGPVLPGTLYTLRFTAKNRYAAADPVLEAVTTTGDTTAPNAPSVSASGYLKVIKVEIALENPPSDLAGFEIWKNTENNANAASLAGYVAAVNGAAFFIDQAPSYLSEMYYWAKSVDAWGNKSPFSASSLPTHVSQILSGDITANQIIGKHFTTAEDVGEEVDGVKFTADGIEMWEDGVRKVLIPVTGDPIFKGLITAAAGFIGGWEIFPTYLQSNNIRLDSAGLLQTLDFVSGYKGWKINQDGNAEFNNLRARGAIKTVVFENDEISAVGGRTLIRPAGVAKDYDYTEFINAAANVYLEECWDKLNTLLDTSYTYVASVFADYDEYYAAELAYYDELCVAMGFNQFACAIKEADYDDATKDAYLTDCWAQLMTLLDLTTATPAIPSMTFAAYETLENGYFDEVATAIDNPPLFEPFINDSDTAIETENADQFNVGDIIRVKDGSANDYWGRISAIVGDILSITGEYGEPFAITAGQTIVNYGIPGSGGILLDGQAPLMDVYTHSGKPWLGADIRLRIGNLNGWGTINDNIYGIAIGQPDGEYLIYDSTSGRLRLNGAIQISEGSGIANFSDAGVLAGLDNIDLSYVTDAGVLAGLDNIDLSYVTDAGALATADNLDDVTDGTTYKRTTANEKTGASRAYSGLDSNNSLITKVLPGAAIGTPLGAGLYFGSDKMGFYSGSDWKTYMDNDGNFYLGGSAAGCGLAWNATTNCLTVCGCITSCEGTIGGWNFNANCLHSNNILINNNGSIYSNNYVAGSAGWCINGAGAAEFSNVTVCGTICSCAGNVGGWTLANGCLSATNAIMYSGAANTARIQLGTGACMGGINSANAGTDILFWGGNTHANRATAPFRVTAAGDLFATNATICGNIFTNCGTLGFWTISSCGLNYCYRTSYWNYDSNITSRGVEFYHSSTNICGAQTYGCVLIDVARCVCSSFSGAKYAQMHICTYDTSFYAFCSNGRIQASAFCVVSDCNLKTDIQHISILPLLRKMPVTKWRFKNSEDYHVGPMAQDFNSVFQLSHDWKTNLTVGGLDGIALRGVQELDECITSLQCKIQKLECEFAAMRERIS